LFPERAERFIFPTQPVDAPFDPGALLATLYDELHRIAQRELRPGGPAFALSATTLLHEVYLNLHERDGVMFPDRARLIAYASCAMRGIIVEYARSGQALKRGAGFELTALPTDIPDLAVDCAELQRLSDAVEQLEAVDTRLAEVVDLRYFSGFSFADIAALWGVSERTVQRDWRKARLFLHQCLSGHA